MFTTTLYCIFLSIYCGLLNGVISTATSFIFLRIGDPPMGISTSFALPIVHFKALCFGLIGFGMGVGITIGMFMAKIPFY